MQNSTNVIYHINKTEAKLHDRVYKCKKNISQNSTPFHGKNSQKLGLERIYLNIIKVIYKKSTINIILNSEKLKGFSLRSRARQGCPLLHFYLGLYPEQLDKKKK